METICLSSEKTELKIRAIEIDYEGRKFICKIAIDGPFIKAKVYLDNKLKFKGCSFLEKIQFQIKAFLDYNLNDVYSEINKLDDDRFLIAEENNKNILKIKWIILSQKKYIIINLNENKEDIDYEEILKDKEKTIKELKEKMKN